MGKKNTREQILKDTRVIIKAFMHLCNDFNTDKAIEYIGSNVTSEDVIQIWKEEADKI